MLSRVIVIGDIYGDWWCIWCLW